MKQLFLNILKKTKFGRYFVSTSVLLRHCFKANGWNKSVRSLKPLDGNNQELPWFSYSAIAFLNEKIKQTHNVFEYGSGNSTIWFSKKVNQITSVEHEEQWYKEIKSKLNANKNINYKFSTLEDHSYEKEILAEKNNYDIIVIDGRERVACTKNSVQGLKENGVIIWDDSDRKDYQEAYDYLKHQGFKRIDFWGLAPIVAYMKCTTVFYKKNNCFDI